MGQGITRKLMNWLGHLTGNLCSHRRVWLCTRRQLSGTQMTSWSQSGLWRHPTAQEVSRCWEPGSGQMHRPQEPQGQTAAAHPSRNLWDWTRCVFQQVPDRAHSQTSCLGLENRNQRQGITSLSVHKGWKLSLPVRHSLGKEQRKGGKTALTGHLQGKERCKLKERGFYIIGKFCEPP